MSFVTYARYTFTSICFVIFVYAIISEILHYLENSDTSTIGYKQFNNSPRDKYPTFTICLKDVPNKNKMYYRFEDDLYNSYGLYPNEYERLLRGEEGTNEVRGMGIQNISGIDHDQFTLKLSDLELGAKWGNLDNDSFSYEGDKEEETKFPFYISHQDPETICFTEKSEFLRKVNLISLRLDKLQRFYGNGSLFFKIYIHHPGQLTKASGMPIFDSQPLLINSQNNYLRLSIYQVSVLRKRPTANVPCNPDLHDDDMKLRMEIIKTVGCFPPYWKSMMSKDGSFDACKTSGQLAAIYRNIKNVKDVMASYEPPCEDMKLVAVVQPQALTGERVPLMLIYFGYMDENYQEIVNIRDFTLAGFWSSVGGFAGMLLGYSVLQFPEIMIMIRAWCRKRNNIMALVHEEA